MSRSFKLLAAVLAAAVLGAPIAHATPVDNRAAAIAGADHLKTLQLSDGGFPWIVGQSGEYQNVQGVTAMGLVDAFKVSLDTSYLDAARKTRDWLANYRATACGATPCVISLANVFFLGEYATLSLTPADFTLARAALQQYVTLHGPTGKDLADYVITARKSQGNTNLGLWDTALFIRAAQDVGATDLADAMAAELASQTIVNPFDTSANWYELGLSGLLMGLSEADLVAYATPIDAAAAALIARQAADGSFSLTYGGVVYPGDIQTTAYAVLGLSAAARIDNAQKGAGALVAAQAANGRFPGAVDGSGDETAEVDGEATSALVAATLLVPSGALDYADAARAYLG